MWNKPHKRPGQIWSMDMIFASLAFVTILLVVLGTNTAVDERIRLKEDMFYMESVAQNVAQNLVTTSGHWYLESENFTSIGLTHRQNHLDPTRVSTFFASDYNETCKGLGTGRWDLRVSLYDEDGEPLNSFGLAPPTDSEVKLVSRLAVYNGEPALLKVEVWE